MIALFSAPFLFLRHGQTALNAADLVAGSTDVPLDDIGREQAAAAAEALAGRRIAVIWSSPLLRARQTAEAIAARHGLAPRIVAELAERNWGAWEGTPRRGLRREATPPGGEAPAAFARRTRRGLALVTPPFPALVVAHSGTARVIAEALSQARPIRRLENGEVVLWEQDRDGAWEARSLNGPAGSSPNCNASVTSVTSPAGKGA